MVAARPIIFLDTSDAAPPCPPSLFPVLSSGLGVFLVPLSTTSFIGMFFFFTIIDRFFELLNSVTLHFDNSHGMNSFMRIINNII